MKNVLLFDYGYKLKSIVEKLKYKDSEFICKNNNDLEKKFNQMLNNDKIFRFINVKNKQKISFKEKLYRILKNQLNI